MGEISRKKTIWMGDSFTKKGNLGMMEQEICENRRKNREHETDKRT